MADVNVGIQLSSLRMPLKKALMTAARLGAQGIEIDARNDLRPEELTDTGRRQLRKMLDDLNLRLQQCDFILRAVMTWRKTWSVVSMVPSRQ